MEDRRFIALKVLLLSAGLFALSESALAYNIETHASLTREIISFADEHFGVLIPEELVPYLIDGSRREDDVPRWMNHFYDPVYNRGLSSIVLGEWQKSKEWAHDEQNQNSFKYKAPATIASILTAIQEKKISALSIESAFTWQKTLNYWAGGDREEAMFTLGHVLHLIEDASVPDHTRNDSHAEGSPYEEWTGRFTLSSPDLSLSERTSAKQPIVLASLDQYFDELAKYSNNNFYSKDTIGIQSGYSLPAPTDRKLENGYWFRIGNDSEFGEYKIAQEIDIDRFSYITTQESKITIGDKDSLVLQDYWRLLSTKTVQHGAGVIHLFFEEAAKMPQPSPRVSFLSQVVDTAKKAAGAVSDFFSDIFGPESSFDYVGTITTQDNESGETEEGSQTQQPTGEAQSPQSTENKPAVLGATADSGTKGLTAIRVIDGDTIVLSNGDIVRYIGIDAPELADDPSKSDCYAQEAKQRNEALVFNKAIRLEKGSEDADAYGRLLRYVWIGEIMANRALVAEGYAYSYNFNKPHPYEGEFESAEQAARDQKIGLWGSACEDNKITTQEDAQLTQQTGGSATCTFETAGVPKRTSLIINEVAWMGTTESSANEWIELKNISNVTVTLAGWQIVNKNGKIAARLSNADQKTLGAGKFMLLERTDDDTVPEVTADLIYAGTLANSNEGIRLFGPGCILADEMLAAPDWPAGDNNTKNTAERSSGFVWRTSALPGGTPKRENSTGQSGGSGSSNPSSNQSAQTQQESSPQFFPIVINEIMYNLEGTDTGREWIEILNTGTSSVDLSEWKLFESDTNHTLTATQGGIVLVGQAYAVIADDPLQFLADHPGYSGVLFDSTFSLSNTGETIGIKNKTLLINSVVYNPLQGADGNGKSLQRFDSIWEEADPTPGISNQHQNANSPSVQIAGHAVISEAQIAGVVADDEFIELYNPTIQPISLSGWSLQYISGKSTTTGSVYKKNFGNDDVIPPQGFFLAANSAGTFVDQADMTYSFSLSGASTGGYILLVSTTTPINSFTDSLIADSAVYGSVALGLPSISVPSNSQSVERKAVHNGTVYLAQGEGEWWGNGYDSDNSGNDFDIRQLPKPQGVGNLPEPRSAPSAPSQFTVIHDADHLAFLLSWGPSYDFNNVTATLSYHIEDLLDPVLSITTTSTAATIVYNEVGRQYQFKVHAEDNEGLASNSATGEIVDVPSFFSELYVFPDTRPGQSEYALEAFYSDPPHIMPDNSYDPPHSQWKLIALYINHDAVKEEQLWDTWLPSDTEYLFHVAYPHCSSGNMIWEGTLIIPDLSDRCGTDGGAYNRAMVYKEAAEDEHFLIKASPLAHAHYNSADPSNNYVTVAFYTTNALMPSNGTVPYFKLVAVDKTHYPIGPFPVHQPPQLPEPLTLSFAQSSSQLTATWSPASDPDSIDSTIEYDIKWTDEGEWQDIDTLTSAARPVNPGDAFNVSVRARDSFGTVSNVLSAVWTYPVSVFVIEQTEATAWSGAFGQGTSYCPECASGASIQSITPASDMDLGVVAVRLWQSQLNDYAILRFAVYPDNGGSPDFSYRLGEAQLDWVYNPDSFADNTFAFPAPVHLLGQQTYWLVLEVKQHSDPRGYGRNAWHNAIATSNPYAGGTATMGTNGTYCEINPCAPVSISDPNADWYMRIGYRE